MQHVGQQPGHAHTQHGAHQRVRQRFTNQQQEDMPVAETDRFENPHFARPLPRTHHHRVGRHQQHGQHDGAANGTQQELEVADHADELQIEGLFRHRPRFVGAVRNARVDRPGDLCRTARVGNGDECKCRRNPGRTAALRRIVEWKHIIVWSNVGDSVVYSARTLNSQIEEPFFCVQIVLRSTSRSPSFLFSRSAIFSPSMQPIWSSIKSAIWSGGTSTSGYSAVVLNIRGELSEELLPLRAVRGPVPETAHRTRTRWPRP